MSEPIQPPSPAGIEQAGVIDLLVHEPEENRVTLVMIEKRPWDGSRRRLFELQEKFNAYLSFALDGEMAEAYPDFVGKPLRLRLDCLTPPDQETGEMLAAIREQIAFQNIELALCIHRPAECAEGCGCHD